MAGRPAPRQVPAAAARVVPVDGRVVLGRERGAAAGGWRDSDGEDTDRPAADAEQAM